MQFLGVSLLHSQGDRMVEHVSRGSQPSVELGWVLLTRLGGPLFTLLPHEPSALCPPLSALTPCIGTAGRLSAELYSLRHHQLPHIHCRPQDPNATLTVRRLGCQGASSSGDICGNHVCDVRVHRTSYIRDTWVSRLSDRCMSVINGPWLASRAMK